MKNLTQILIAAITTTLTACTTVPIEPTPYQPAQKISPTEYGPGYVIQKWAEGSFNAQFTGNKGSTDELNLKYAKLAAYEHCRSTGNWAYKVEPAAFKLVDKKNVNYANAFHPQSVNFYCLPSYHTLVNVSMRDSDQGILLEVMNADKEKSIKSGDLLLSVNNRKTPVLGDVFSVANQNSGGKVPAEVSRAGKVKKVQLQFLKVPGVEEAARRDINATCVELAANTPSFCKSTN